MVLHYIKILLRLLQHGPRLIKEVIDVLDTCNEELDTLRRNLPRDVNEHNASLAIYQTAAGISRIIKEINDVKQLVGKILD